MSDWECSKFGLAQLRPEGKIISTETGREISEDPKDSGVRWIELRYDPEEIPDIQSEFETMMLHLDREVHKDYHYAVLLMMANAIVKDDQ